MKYVNRLLIVVALAMLPAIVLPATGGVESRIKGKLPALEDVFGKLFAASIRVFSLDQLQKEFSALSDEERGAMPNFIGKERWEKALQGLEEPKKKLLESSYQKYIGKSDGATFRKNLPNIMATNANLMTPEQVKQSLGALDDKEMGTLTISMGNDGLKTLFTKAKRDRHAVIMESTPDWVILDMGLRNYDTFRDYTCVLKKIERLGDKLQGEETVEVKYRVKPQAIYAKWVKGPWTGREALYNESAGKDKLRVRESGMLGAIPVTVPLDSIIAKRGTNHLLNEVGFGYLLNLSLRDFKAAMPFGDMTRKNIGMQEIDGKPVFVMDSILRKNPKVKYYCHRLRSYIDYTNSLQIKAETFDWDDKLVESYTYINPKFNVGLKDIDFDQSNPSYRLK